MRLKVKNCSRFRLPGSNKHFIHLGTIEYGIREFIVFHCTAGPKAGNTYIEEVVLTSVDWTEDVFANCKFVSDDNLAQDLAAFATEQGLLNIT